jgi:hypothetical protein
MIPISTIALGALLGLGVAAPLPAGKPIRNHADWVDVEGKPISCHDGGMARVGDTFYWYGTSYEGNPRGLWGRRGAHLQRGFNVYSSRNLVDWKYEGVCLEFPRDGRFGLGTSHRPNVLHNRRTDKYVMWFFLIGARKPEYPDQMLTVAVADRPTGPFEILGQRRTAEAHGWGQDLGLFRDDGDDGKGYLVYDDGHRSIRVDLLSDDYTSSTGRTAIALAATGKKHEGAAMVKYRGKYIVAGSFVEGWNPTDTSYAVATAPLGPYREMGLMSRRRTWNSQISNFVYIRESDIVFAMCDQWFVGPNGLDRRLPIDRSRQLWLPVDFDPETGVAMMRPVESWDPFPRGRRREALSGAPYPPSALVVGLTWDDEVLRLRNGAGDNWPITWVEGDLQITAFGDGDGFDADNPDLSLGFAKITGDPPAHRGEDFKSDADAPEGGGNRGIKASGLLMVGDFLYLFVRNYRPEPGNDYRHSRLAWSADRGRHWKWAEWHFSETFGCPEFIQFGPGYRGARDGYVYIVSQANDSAYEYSPDIVLARVERDRVRDRESYEFYAGGDTEGEPRWEREIEKRQPIFTDRNGTQRIAVTYNAALRRYILTTSHLPPDKKATHTAALGVFEAPAPWGPWKTIDYDHDWSRGARTYHHKFPTRWMSSDGKSMWLLFSGLDGGYYTFCLRKATLEIAAR